MNDGKIKSIISFLGYSRDLEIRYRFTYIVNIFSTGCIFIFLFLFILFTLPFKTVLETFFYLLAMLFVFLFLKLKKFDAARLILFSGFFLQVYFLIFIWFPAEIHFSYFLFLVAPISFFTYDFQIPKERKMLIGVNILAIAMLFLNDQVHFHESVITVTPLIIRLFNILLLLSTIPTIFIVSYFYATNLSRTHRELQLLANTDSLTQIYNRRTLFREGDLLFRFCLKYNRDFTLLLIDVDYFKKVNDTYGHPAGDAVLVSLTELLHKNIRQNDILARYGGEEFVVIIKDSESACSCRVAEKLREKIEQNDFIINKDLSLHITVSIGISCSNNKSESFDQILRNADKALYMAKTSGRNNVKTVK